MTGKEPTTELQQFSSDDAIPTQWFEVRECLEPAEVYWLSTVRPDGRTSRSWCPSGWMAPCTSPPAGANAKRRTSRSIRTASS